MLDPKLIESWISTGLPCEHLSVAGDGHHFEAVIVSEKFFGLNRVKRQQTIYALLKDRLDSGELHAISMRTLTPEEWHSTNG